MANDVYTYAEQCPSRQKHRQHPTHQRPLQLFPPARPPEFVAMGILGPRPKRKAGNRLVGLMTDGNSKLTRAIPTRTATTTDVARIFVED